jgi:hypothetical protein
VATDSACRDARLRERYTDARAAHDCGHCLLADHFLEQLTVKKP